MGDAIEESLEARQQIAPERKVGSGIALSPSMLIYIKRAALARRYVAVERCDESAAA
jgi:hypothetical protein